MRCHVRIHPDSAALPRYQFLLTSPVYADDCWMVTRDSNGHGAINVDPVRFPSGIRALADYVHSKGLKFGIYQAPGSVTPQGRPGLRNHEQLDVATFCHWQVDYIKLGLLTKLFLLETLCPCEMIVRLCSFHHVILLQIQTGRRVLRGRKYATRSTIVRVRCICKLPFADLWKCVKGGSIHLLMHGVPVAMHRRHGHQS
eukprot:SAG31_NODE_122_length_23797_cov_39.343812_7_plen_199_part_00